MIEYGDITRGLLVISLFAVSHLLLGACSTVRRVKVVYIIPKEYILVIGICLYMANHKVNFPFVQLANFVTAYIAEPVTIHSKYGIL